MKKGNKILLSLFAIGVCLLPFSLSDSLSIYIYKENEQNISISGSVSSTKHTVNVYLPTYGESESYILSTSFKAENGAIISDEFSKNGIDFSAIDNKFSYSGSIFSNSTLTNNILLTDAITSDLSIYPEYFGYGVKGNNSNKLEFLSFVDDANYNYGSLVPIDGTSANIYKHILTKEYVYESSLGSYDELHSSSGQYYVKFNSNNNTNVFERYLLFNCSSWREANAYIKFQCYKYGDGSGHQILNINDQNTKVIDGITYYELYLTPYRNSFFYERYDPNNLSNRWNYSGTFNFSDNNYSKDIYKFKTGNIFNGSTSCTWL